MFDFASATPESVTRTAEEAIARAQELASNVTDPANPLRFETVLAPVDEIKNVILSAESRSTFLKNVHPDPEVREAAFAAYEKTQAWNQYPESPRSIELAFDPAFNDVVQRYAVSSEGRALSGERRRMLDLVLRDLHLVGHHLDSREQMRLREISDRLVSLASRFAKNIADHEDHLLLGDDDLEGLPDSYVDSLPVDEETGRRKVTMTYPHVVPFQENSPRRDLREQLSFKFNNRAVAENRPLLEEALRLRLEAARLLGFDSWADRVLSTRMAKTKDRVDAMYEGLIPALTKKGEEEIATVAALLEYDTGDTLVQLWDWNYYNNQIRKTDFGVDQVAMANYFPLPRVLAGMFDLTGEVFGLTYREVDTPTWHEEVRVFQVDDAGSGEPLGTFYLDLHPREGKFTHAAVFPGVPGKSLHDGSYQKPTCAMVCNFTPPTGARPSLLKHNEVETLFHEFGHVLHVLLARSELAYLSGDPEWDFIEAPSQIMQHWVWRPEILQRFARHHETGEPIPTEMVDGLVAARQLNRGMFYLRQVQFGLLDQELHGPEDDKDLDRILRSATEVSLLPYQEGTFFPASFGHLMGGYDAGYYGYLWSEVFGDDMFSRFEEEGILSPEVGMRYRTEVIGRGATLEADEMLRNFLGREPNNEAFLRKAGIG